MLHDSDKTNDRFVVVPLCYLNILTFITKRIVLLTKQTYQFDCFNVD